MAASAAAGAGSGAWPAELLSTTVLLMLRAAGGQGRVAGRPVQSARAARLGGLDGMGAAEGRVEQAGRSHLP